MNTYGERYRVKPSKNTDWFDAIPDTLDETDQEEQYFRDVADEHNIPMETILFLDEFVCEEWTLPDLICVYQEAMLDADKPAHKFHEAEVVRIIVAAFLREEKSDCVSPEKKPNYEVMADKFASLGYPRQGLRRQ